MSTDPTLPIMPEPIMPVVTAELGWGRGPTRAANDVPQRYGDAARTERGKGRPPRH